MGRARAFTVFVLVNVLNTGLYYVLYLLLLGAVPYLVANVLALTVAVLVAYAANARFAFQVRPTRRSLVLFVVTNLTTMALRTAVVWLLVEFLAISERLAPLPAAVATLPIAYLLTAMVMRDRGGAATGPARPPLVRGEQPLATV